ncbi:GNAT family N-acetyltransferase [Burkholderia sp. SG-MS1]|uniref:GNAT family N-acetyltransferase n=1 Tax=Paraburkholderia sp. SG-MS1 TaxID=2023741 RepID=UPI0014478923|nr:GNAT family N-acetyltransferase [Paraburkholderia sp. SG-MS1]NKJ47756.1 GNAT family N-acetyltransferase [Paraburkholderia sp. SG-MS1]
MHAVEPVCAEALRSDHERGALRFRPARVEDAEACAPLIFASGVQEFGFFLGEPAAVCVEFLTFAFTSKFGRFSYRRHRVAVTGDQQVAAVLAVHDGRGTRLDDPHVALMLLMFFGVRRTIRMLLRGLVLESELPAPKSSQTLIAHCATRETMRGTGVFSALFANALHAGSMDGDGGREIVLDVLMSNTRAYDLYRRLGFVELPRRGPVSARLPRELESVRMALCGPGATGSLGLDAVNSK